MTAHVPRHPDIAHASEAELVARVRAGDEAAFEAVFHAYHARLCAFVYRFVNARDLAEEIVQEVFLFVWERRETWEVRTSLRSYLFTAVRNGAMSYLRHEHVVRRREAEAIDFFSSTVPQPDRELGTRELAVLVRRAVDRLPPRCGLIFTMHREQGLTYAEIAQVLGISPRTVEVQMGRALKGLRKSLKGLWP